MIPEDVIKQKAFSMPFTNPTFARGPYRFINREYLIITYETEMEALKNVVPAPLKIEKPYVKFEFIKMPDSSCFGDYTESGQVIPVTYQGKKGDYVHAMYLDSEKPIAAGREIWGFPKTFAYPSLKIDNDVMIGELFYQKALVARATMTYKQEKLDHEILKKEIEQTDQYLLKIIPNPDGSQRICELVSLRLENIQIKQAYTGCGDLELFAHVMAPNSHLPIKKIISSVHFVADLTLPFGKIVHNYLN